MCYSVLNYEFVRNNKKERVIKYEKIIINEGFTCINDIRNSK